MGTTEVQESKTDRRHFIGGTDAAGILGLSRWTTPLRIWAEKTGAIPAEKPETFQMKLGKLLEDAVVQLFEEKTGLKTLPSPGTQFHPEYPFIGGTIDRLIEGEDAILEAKTAAGWKAKEWSDEEMPIEYVIQVAHYLAVTGKKAAYLACLVGNQQFHVKKISRTDPLNPADPSDGRTLEHLLQDLIRKEVSFWKTFVEPNVMPSIVKAADRSVLDELYPRAIDGKEIILTDEANQLIEALNAYSEDYKSLGRQIDQTENELKKLLGDAARGSTSRYEVMWKNRPERRFDVKGFKLAHPDLAAQFCIEKEQRRFDYRAITREA